METTVEQQQAHSVEQQQGAAQETFDVMMQRRQEVVEAARQLVKAADAEDLMFEVWDDDLSSGDLMGVIRARIDDLDMAIAEMHKAGNDWHDAEEGVGPKTDGELVTARLDAEAELISGCAALQESLVSNSDPRFVKPETLLDFTFVVSESREEVAALRHMTNSPEAYAVINAALDVLAADYAIFEAAMKKLRAPGPIRWTNYARHAGVRVLDAVAAASTIAARAPNAQEEAAEWRAHVARRDEADAKAKAEATA